MSDLQIIPSYKFFKGNNSMRKHDSQSGFSLIELILYIALISIFLSGAIYFAWDVIYSGKKSDVHRNLNENMRIVSKRILYEIRNASAVNSVSATSLCLASANSTYNPTRIYSSSNTLRIAWGGGSANCTSMTHDAILTSANVQLTSLTFTDLTLGSSRNIKFAFTIASTGVRQEWQKSISYTGSGQVRN